MDLKRGIKIRFFDWRWASTGVECGAPVTVSHVHTRLSSPKASRKRPQLQLFIRTRVVGDDMVLLAHRLNREFCHEQRLDVAILDNYKAARAIEAWNVGPFHINIGYTLEAVEASK